MAGIDCQTDRLVSPLFERAISQERSVITSKWNQQKLSWIFRKLKGCFLLSSWNSQSVVLNRCALRSHVCKILYWATTTFWSIKFKVMMFLSLQLNIPTCLVYVFGIYLVYLCGIYLLVWHLLRQCLSDGMSS